VKTAQFYARPVTIAPPRMYPDVQVPRESGS
jgi:hypothetical protein